MSYKDNIKIVQSKCGLVILFTRTRGCCTVIHELEKMEAFLLVIRVLHTSAMMLGTSVFLVKGLLQFFNLGMIQ